MRTTLKVLNEKTGGLSSPSKMPGTSYSIPTKYCNVGTKLRDVPGSVCHKCYAHNRGFYAMPKTKNALENRYATMLSDDWVESMVGLIRHHTTRLNEPFHRWFDSGDIPSRRHLARLVVVALRLPDIKFWLPTKEYGLIREWLKENGDFPENLTVRVSAPMKDQRLNQFELESVVLTDSGDLAGSYPCPAPTQGNECGECRACWSKEVKEVAYHEH